MPSSRNKIVWAIDPMQDPAEVTNLINELTVWAESLDCDIQPVSIFSNRTLNLPVELEFPWKDNFDKMTQKMLTQYFEQDTLQNILKSERLFVASNSVRKMAEQLVNYAEKEKAILIFANSRHRKTWNPFRLGSFADSLVTLSEVPVMLVSPEAKVTPKITNILFPADFSTDSESALAKLIPWAKVLKSKITIFSVVQIPYLYLTEIDYTPAENYELLISSIESFRRNKGQEWVSSLNKQDLKAEIIVQRQVGPIGSDIVQVAEENQANLIALASQSGPVSRFVLGSIAKDVLSQAKCPVLIFYHTKEVRTRVQLPKNWQSNDQNTSTTDSVIL